VKEEEYYIDKERCTFAGQPICRSGCSQNLCTRVRGIDADFSEKKRKKFWAAG